MDNYIPFSLKSINNKTYDFSSLEDNANELCITMIDADNLEKKIIFYDCFCYRKIDEGDALLTLAKISKSGGTGKCFYEVSQSSFLKWFLDEKHTENHMKFKHFCITTINEIIDVISITPPKIL